MRKAPEAFRTISEAADALDTPAHVLRFWESKFTHVKPVKRAGGRRYYRPADIDLLSGIKLLLHDQGMTIRGVQKLLQEKGARHVAGLAPVGAEALDAVIEPPVSAAVQEVPLPAALPDAIDDAQSPRGPDAGDALNRQTDLAVVPPQVANQPEAAPSLPKKDSASTGAMAKAPSDAEPPASDRPNPAAVAAPDDSPVAAPGPSADDTPEEPADSPAPVLAAMLDAISAPPEPARFARIAHALRINPPRDTSRFAPALSRLEQLVQHISERVE